MVDLINLIPFIGVIIIGGAIILLIKNKEQVYIFLKDQLKQWWKNRNKDDTND